jgi:hypothetical protein
MKKSAGFPDFQKTVFSEKTELSGVMLADVLLAAGWKYRL